MIKFDQHVNILENTFRPAYYEGLILLFYYLDSNLRILLALYKFLSDRFKAFENNHLSKKKYSHRYTLLNLGGLPRLLDFIQSHRRYVSTRGSIKVPSQILSTAGSKASARSSSRHTFLKEVCLVIYSTPGKRPSDEYQRAKIVNNEEETWQKG